MGLFGGGETITTTFVANDRMSAPVKGIRGQMERFKRDAMTGFGLGAGISLFSAASVALGGVVTVLKGAVESAIAEEQSLAKLDAALLANVDNWNGNRDAIDEVVAARMALGFSDDEQRDSLATLLASTGDVTAALDIQRTAMDLARLKGIDLQAASDALGKAYLGNTGLIKRMGIELDKGATSTEALGKVQEVARGQAEAWAETTQGTFTTMQTSIDEAMETIGTEMLPMFKALAEFIRDDVVPAFKELVGFIGEVGTQFNNLNRILHPEIAAQQDAAAAVRNTARAYKMDAAALQDMALELWRANGGQERANKLMRRGEGLTFRVATEAENAAEAWNLYGDQVARTASVMNDLNAASRKVAANIPLLGSLLGGGLGGGLRSGGGFAGGGTVQRNSVNVVGERGPELLMMGNQSGTVIPNHQLGGGMAPIIVNIDGQKLFDIMDRRQGRGFSMSG